MIVKNDHSRNRPAEQIFAYRRERFGEVSDCTGIVYQLTCILNIASEQNISNSSSALASLSLWLR